MTASEKTQSTPEKPKSSGFAPNIVSDLATGLFSIPEGMAYAQLAGVNPVYGLYSGVVAVIVSSLTTGTILMMSTLTSAIAPATGSVMQSAGIQDSQMPQALFTITFLVGTIMFVLGILRLGSIVNFVSNAVMTGFVAGASLLIILGQEHHLTGYSPAGSKSSQSRDFVGEGLGNLVGSFFQSMATGGSLSRTGVSVGAGANSRWGGVFAGVWLGLIVLLFGSSAEMVPLAVIGGMLTVVGVELIVARVPSAQLVLRTGAWGPIAALAITFFSALFIPLQFTIFLGAGLSLVLYVIASAKKTRVQQAVRLEDGGWEMRDAEKALKPNEVTVLVVQGLDFFAEVPVLEDQAPTARGVSNAVVVLVLHDMRTVTNTAIRWLESYAQKLKDGGGVLMLADVHPAVMETLKHSGALDVIGADNVFSTTTRLLAAENMAWEAADRWLQQGNDANQAIDTQAEKV